MSIINTGDLNRRCRIEYKAPLPDAHFGTEVITWTPLASVWCELQDILPSKGAAEAVNNGLVISSNKTRVRMRYRSDVNSSMRLVALYPVETIYQIIAGPAVLGNKEGLEMMVEKYSS